MRKGRLPSLALRASVFASLALRAGVVAAVLACGGCTVTPQQYWQALKGEGFPGWDESSPGMRGSMKGAKPSGFFTDRRSEQIEQSLGGGF